MKSRIVMLGWLFLAPLWAQDSTPTKVVELDCCNEEYGTTVKGKLFLRFNEKYQNVEVMGQDLEFFIPAHLTGVDLRFVVPRMVGWADDLKPAEIAVVRAHPNFSLKYLDGSGRVKKGLKFKISVHPRIPSILFNPNDAQDMVFMKCRLGANGQDDFSVTAP